MRPVKYARADDGASLAWVRGGSGVPLVKPANWLTHLQYDDDSPIWADCVEKLRFRA
ncbi:MAG: hypothetical protein GKR99_02990 [Rhodobacteraceae bacterium]|nr:hypothetical protein [Paracoccaceae bacterium]